MLTRISVTLLGWVAITSACDVPGHREPSTPDMPDRAEPDAIWHPAVGTTWQWQLSGSIDTSVVVEAYDVDLFDATAATIETLHADGRRVICYFSAGTHENWRDDAGAFPGDAIGNALPDWPGERWLDVRDEGVRAALSARLDLAADRGCDAVEPDNVDGYTNDSGFDFGAEDQLAFNRWLADEAHARGLSVGLKNDIDQVAALEPAFDWALDEECMAFDECDALTAFVDAGKAVFHTEYVDDRDEADTRAAEICEDAIARGFSTLVKTWDLDAFRVAC